MDDLEKLILGFEHTHQRYVNNHIQNAKFNSISAMRAQLKKIQIYLYFNPNDKDKVYKRLQCIIGCEQDEFNAFYLEEIKKNL